MNKEIITKHCYANSSAQKLRLISNLIKGKNAIKALEILKYNSKKASNLIKKVLKSAISNFKIYNINTNVKLLYIKKIFIDEGSRSKRIFPRAKGKTDYILKRTSHINIILSDN
ncbi:50S ribosomal protein L22 [Enterobacteriaceae bacterium ET-AT1-13]|nr:50S ribosomal protein L22 [Enterobacteriaceae bacterium ET-AT1-13]WGS66333.1 50S ribosomal protein L22 [Enterobacteriaceae bacterium Cmel17]WMC17356.1 MAG: 50S ribosomal protein L22 [Enterobacteriaceae bacterium Cmel21]WMC17563.1 MAG: 50S ribosomal protein L22 [Enterobacteriaceae bacterium PSmelAO3-2]WMC17768.1 MAG: 50S ribosomal protein L22 [Enterobacteriaceae bacterium PSmelAO3-1]WMC17971.1 MAG: 50S ribosomal protein L22 [Enterobacteriaceae bacterium PSmelAO1]